MAVSLAVASVTAGSASAVFAVQAGKPTADRPRGCAPAPDWGIARHHLAARLLRLVNAYRARLHLRRLESAPALRRSAAWKAGHMARYGYMAHFDPAPPLARTLPVRLAACGFSGVGGGENLAYAFDAPEDVLTAWLRSPSHRAVLQRPHWSKTGIGVAVSADGLHFWAQNFGA